MVGLKLTGVIPHPAFDTSLLSQSKGKAVAIAERGGSPLHYPTGYLQGITSPAKDIDSVSKSALVSGFCKGKEFFLTVTCTFIITTPSLQASDVVGYTLYLVASIYTSLMAWLSPFWIFDSYHLNLVAWLNSPREAIFFRHIILLEVSIMTHLYLTYLLLIIIIIFLQDLCSTLHPPSILAHVLLIHYDLIHHPSLHRVLSGAMVWLLPMLIIFVAF